MGRKRNKGAGSFRTLKPEEVPDNIKNLVGGEEKKGVKAISGAQRDFVKLQEDYHETSWQVAVTNAELDNMMKQIKMPEEERSMKWQGMKIPDNVLKAMTGRKNVMYKQLLHHQLSVKKALLNYGLTEEQISVAGEDGHYVTEIPKKEVRKINTGEVGG
jgi:hypothetical protein